MVCSDFRDDMMEVIYGEASGATLRRFQEHLQGCPPCREEVSALEGVRGKLPAWTLPPLGRAPRPSPWLWSLRGLAAAAALLFALGTGLGLSGSEVRYTDGRLSVHLGHTDAEVERLLAEQRERFASEAAVARPAALPSGGDEALLRRVEELIQKSDERHAQLVRSSLDAYERKIETERRLDLARVSAGFSYLEGKTGQDVARTAQLVGYVLQASDKR
jgi:hypothetical protein